MTTLYIAGPVTGMPDDNREAFADAAKQLRSAGYWPIDPTEGGRKDGWKWWDYVRRGLYAVKDADGVALLPGWWGSHGARVEVRLAEALGKPVKTVAEWLADAPE